MSSNPVVRQSSRVRCSRCSRFVFKGDACRCTRRAVVYEPQHDGVMPHVRLTLSKVEADVHVTARHHTPLDADGNWNSFASFGTGDGTASEANEERFS